MPEFYTNNIYPISSASQLKLLKAQNEALNDNIRRYLQEKSYDYYAGDSTQIEYYLELIINRLLGNEITKDKEWIYDWLNITQKFINRQAVIYKDPAIRYFEDDNEAGDLANYYNSIIPADVNSKNKKAHRFAKLFNTSLTQVAFNKDTGKIDYIIEPSYKIKVKTDEFDYNKISEFSYEKELKNIKGETEVFDIVWTDTQHYKRDIHNNESSIGNNEAMKNPYKVIPVSILRLTEGEDFWGVGAEDVVNMNEMVNFLLTFLANDAIILGSSGTLLAVNLDLLHKGEVSKDSGLKKVRAGRRHPIVVENASTDKAAPRLEYVSTNPLITEIQQSIDYRIKQVAVLKGLNPNTIISEVKDTSDYQKMMDSLEQIEIRRDDIEPCRTYEEELFKITRIVNNTAYQDKELRAKFKLQEIPEDAVFKVDFAEIEVELTNTELWADRKEKLALNLISVLDIMMEEDPDLTEEEARARLEENRNINTTIGSNQPKGLAESLGLTNNIGQTQ